MSLPIDDISPKSIITINKIRQRESKGFDDEPAMEQRTPIAGMPIVVSGVNVPFIAGTLYMRNTQGVNTVQPIVFDSRDFVLQRLNDINYIRYFGIPVEIDKETEKVVARIQKAVETAPKPATPNSIVGMQAKAEVK